RATPDTSAGENIVAVKEFIVQWAAATREGHRLAKESQEHADKTLTWVIGLMGAGIFASKDFLAGAPANLRLATLLPWIAGIMCAVAGRFLFSEFMPLSNLHHYDRVSRMQSLPLILHA